VTTNTFVKPSVVAKMALANLITKSVMLPLVHRDYEEEFVQGAGDTVTVRKPATFVSQEFTGTVVPQNVTESSVAVVLNHHRDITINIGAKERALDIKDFQEQVITPAMEAHAKAVDQDILTFRNDIVQEVGTNGSTPTGLSGTNEWDWTNPRCMIDAGRVLDQRDVPESERYVVLGSTTSAKWLGDDILAKASDRGDIRGRADAYLGNRLWGFEPYKSNNVTGGDSEISVGFHRTAVAFVSRPLMIPEGAARAEYVTQGGIGMRVVYGYDISTKKDEISLDLIYGVKTLDAKRAVLITGGS
jgi:hypothetical protein